MLMVDSNITAKSTNDVLELMKSLTVIPVAIGVLRAKLLGMKQKRDEPLRTFSLLVRGKAETCEFFTNSDCESCHARNRLNYTDHMMRDVLIAGIYDADIRREVLGVEGIVDRSVNEIKSLLEKKEIACDANIVTGNTFAISSRQEAGSIFRAPKVTGPPSGFLGPNSIQKAQKIPCPKCNEQFAPYSEGPRGWNSKPFEICRNCFRSRRHRQKSKFSNPPSVSGIFEQESDLSLKFRQFLHQQQNHGYHHQFL